MKFDREFAHKALGVAKVIIAGYGVIASVRHLFTAVADVRGRRRGALYVDLDNLPPDRVDEYLTDVKRRYEGRVTRGRKA